MKQVNRPTQISSLLETISSNGYAEISAELETYITNLETQVSELESKQQVRQSGNRQTSSSNPYNLPVWSYKRKFERQQ